MKSLPLIIVITLFFACLAESTFAQAPVLSYSPATNVYTAGTTITTLSPTNTGGAVSTGALTTFATIPGSTQPYGIAYDPTTGDIITNSFSGGDVYVYSPTGALLHTYTTDIGAGGPKDIVVDASGNIYQANPIDNDVVKITPAGVFSTITGSPTAMNTPDGMAIDAAGNIYVGDQGSDIIYKIAPGATTATVYAKGFTDLYGVTVNSSGQVYASEYNPASAVVKVTSGSTTGGTAFVSGFNSPRNLSIDASGNLYLADEGAGTIVEITPGGVTSTYVSGLTQPRATCFDTNGNTYIANSGGDNVMEKSPANYSISIPLPTGMSFNTTTGQISGTPTVTSPTTTYTIAGHNASGTGYTTVTLTVNPTAPTTTGDYNCGPGVVNLSVSGGYPSGGTYDWYAASSGGSSLNTGSTYSPSIAATTTYYVDYTQGGVTCAARVAVVGTISADPIISSAPTSGSYFSYGFTGGSTTDLSGSSNTATTHGSPTSTADRYSTSGNAMNFTAASSQYISTGTNVGLPGPSAFSISVWFKTTTAGGYLVGFGSSQTGSSLSVDRVIYMGTNGELYFGVSPLGVKSTINTITTYNDGNWHHAVATFSTTNGSNMYVDGALAASNPALNAVLSLGGYWRIAFDSLSGWTNAPATAAATYFNGAIDDVAVENTELTWAQVNVLYGAGSGAFCSGNTLSLTANTVAGTTYSWVGPSGSGFTSSSQNPTVPAANAIAGTYVLTVTNATGCASTINVTAPGNVITYTWSGAAGTTSLTTAGNWDHLPLFTSTSNLVIPTGLAKYPVMLANTTAYNVTLGATATLSLNGFTLNVGCDIVNNASTSGDGIIYGGSNSSGINWNGTVAAQSYTGTNTATTAQLATMTVNNTASGTVTISGGPVDIFNTLTMTQGNLVVSATTGSALNLKSTATQSANVTAIPSACSITGTVNVERYLTGGAGYRTYRLISSPVYASTVSSNNVYSIKYLQSYAYLTGAGPIATTLFDKAGNPTLYLYREDQVPLNGTFTDGNFWGISSMASNPSYSVTGGNPSATASYNIPVGNGVMFFFRGNRASAALATETLTSYTTPVTVTTVTSGTLNQGQVTVHDWYTPASANIGYTSAVANTAVRGFNLVGNPYASSIDWSTFSNSVSTAPIYGLNLAPTIWTFDPGTKNYATYNATTGIATGNGGKIIASGQGFFVQAVAASPALTFQESAKSSTQVTGGKLLMDRRTDLSTLSQGAYNSYLRLKMIADSVNYSDVVVGFNAGSSTKFNPVEDSRFMAGSGNLEAISAYSSDSIKTSAKWVPFPKDNTSQTIRLHVYGEASGQYTLSRTELNQIPAMYNIWLIDSYKKDSLDIKNNETYVFDIDNSDTSSFGDNRFQIVVRQDPALMVHLLNFAATKAPAGSQVAWITENEENYTDFAVERSTDGGSTWTLLGGVPSASTGTYSFLDKNPQNGADSYRLQITDLNGTITYSNVVTIMYGSSSGLVKTGISVYPNPAKSTLNLSIAAGFNPGSSTLSVNTVNTVNTLSPGASYEIQIANILGSVIKKATTSQQNWQTDVSGLTPGTYVIQVTNKSTASVVGQGTFVKL